MENQPLDEPSEQDESFLKPKVKAKRTLTDEQRLVLAQRMKAINDKRIADAMEKKAALAAPIETPKPAKAERKKTIKIVEVSEPESESESEDEQIIYVQKAAPAKKAPAKKAAAPKKAPAKKPKAKPVNESESEDEQPAKIVKSKQAKQSKPVDEPPKIYYRFL
jgi:phage FluMu protein Com